jgi:hypothetical protein
VATEPLRMSVVVAAEPEEVWEYFTRAEAMVTWMGHYALLDARPGGEFAIDVNESQIRGAIRGAPPSEPARRPLGLRGFPRVTARNEHS